MGARRFGGQWTEEKLEALRIYLELYLGIFTKNPGAKKLTRVYVDAFAGTGYREQTSTSDPGVPLFPELAKGEAEAFREGSTRIALKADPGFHHYYFIEKDPAGARELERLKREFPNRAARVKIIQEDANAYLQRWAKEAFDWRYSRAIVFLDPYGMQVEWATIAALAETKAVDLWMLFPLGQGVLRLLTKKRPPPEEWARIITRILGTDEWRRAWYRENPQQKLFEEIGNGERLDINWHGIVDFVVSRLKTVYADAATKHMILRNSSNVPLYLLTFAASNPRGAKPAIRIAEWILGRPRHGRK